MDSPEAPISVDCPICNRTATRCSFDIVNRPLWRCSRCDMEFIHPQPADADLARIYGRCYYNAWGLGTDEAPVRKMKTLYFRKLLNRVKAAIPPEGKILDVGCAMGYFLEVASSNGFEPFGVELSAYGAEVCRRKFGAGRIHEGILETAEFKDCPAQRVDAIFMCDLLEHVRNPVATLQAARRWLSPGGCLLITTPNVSSWSHRFFGRRWLHYKPEHLFYFGPRSLERLLADIGFGEAFCWDTPKQLSLRYARHQLAAFGLIGERFGRCIDRLPEGVLDGNLSVKLGEVTVMVKAI